MKRFISFSFLIVCLVLDIQAQKPKKQLNSPKENSKVTKEYDENGNLTKFDSVYTYSWSGDTTLMNSLTPENFPNLFGDHFGFFPDSTFLGNSFFEDFDQFSNQAFNGTQDSVLLKKFGNHPQLPQFDFNTDSLAMNFDQFDEFFQNFDQENRDSVQSHSQIHQPESMDEMMKMLQQHMQEMEEQQRKMFKN